MTPIEAIILGIVQGLTEFLPISSSAHVQIAQELLDLGELSKPQLTAFIATIQLGTEFAVLLFFWKDILRILGAWGRDLKKVRSADRKAMSQDAKLGWYVIFGTLPIVILGLLFQEAVETQLRSLWIIAFTLIVFGILLGIADKFGRKEREIQELKLRDGILLGLGQALALVPGVSRSGGTISVGLILGFSRAAAARYSFLLAIPAVIASGFYQFAKYAAFLPQDLLIATVIATLLSFIVGYSVIFGLLKYLVKGSFLPFVIWRVGVGTILLVLLTTGQVTA